MINWLPSSITINFWVTYLARKSNEGLNKYMWTVAIHYSYICCCSWFTAVNDKPDLDCCSFVVQGVYLKSTTNICLSRLKCWSYCDAVFWYWSHFHINNFLHSILYLWHWVFIFFTKSLSKIMNPVLSTYLHPVSTPECIGAFECQCTSLIKLYAKSECLYMIGTQNVSAAKSLIAVDISLVTLILSVGRIPPL